MIDSIQRLVDGLAQRLQRSVAVDDAGLRLLAASAHFGPVDEARLGSLVGRRVAGPLRDHVMARGAQSWRTTTRLPANPAVGLDRDRWCFPLRSRYELLGFMWLMDDGGPDTEVPPLAEEVALQIQDLLIRRLQSDVSTDVEVESLVLGLLSPERVDRVQAARDITDMGLFRRARHFSVVVLSTGQDADPDLADRATGEVRRAFAEATQGSPRELFAYAVAADESILVRGHRGVPRDAELLGFARDLHASLVRLDPEVGAASTVGIGGVVSDLEDVEGAVSQAGTAAGIARRSGEPVASWADQPLDALLAALLPQRLRASDLPSVLRGLTDLPEETQAVVATFLHNAGNVARTAEDLHLHRTTVYHRLARFSELTGLDLDTGDARLLLHLWFTIRELVPIV